MLNILQATKVTDTPLQYGAGVGKKSFVVLYLIKYHIFWTNKAHQIVRHTVMNGLLS